MNWEHVLNTYGLPMMIIAGMAFAFYKGIWPRITQYLDDQRQIAEDARKALVNRAEALEKREDTVLTGFKDILDSSAQRNQKQLEILDQISTITKDTNEVSKDTNELVRKKFQ